MCTLICFRRFRMFSNTCQQAGDYTVPSLLSLSDAVNVILSLSNVTLPPTKGTTHVDLSMTAFYSQVTEEGRSLMVSYS